MSADNFDVVVIGSGPGGYVAAIRASQLGLKTALIEKGNLGGTCLNVGCIPSKALLHSTEMLHFTKDKAANHGIQVDGVSVDLSQLMKRKDTVVNTLKGGVEMLVTKKGGKIFKGLGVIQSPGTVLVKQEDGEITLQTKHIIIATGSTPIELPFLPYDSETIVSSDQAIAFDSIPEKLAVIGASAIGLELGSVWARLGSEVTIVEYLPKIAPGFDDDICKISERVFKRQGLKFLTATEVTSADSSENKVVLKAQRKGKEVSIEADKVLVAVGRKPNTLNAGIEEAGVKVDEKGRIEIDHHFQSNIPGIYAIGDVVAGPMLAHKAEEEGVAVAEIIAGKAGHVNYDVIPGVIYTDPEIASVGLSEQQAQESGIEVNTGKFNLSANGRAISSDVTEGMVKVIADAKSDKLLGVQILAHNASELIAAAVTHMEYGGSAEDLARTIHAHPTLSESLKEAALAVDGRGLHSI
ncbi:MAG: dihydrolipoyl dehydrogenase [Opitutales bacterium]|jgi:dihydrolipoamide dehydrogenase|nr:dihydrolipoyl dehydrogenase [Opitutales bacterium]